MQTADGKESKYASMRDNLPTLTRKVVAAALCARSYNPLKNHFILGGALTALPASLAILLLQSPLSATATPHSHSSLIYLLQIHPELWLLLLQPLLSCWLFGIAGTLHQRELQNVVEQVETLHSKAILDPLTGISNRRYFLDIFPDELARSQRNNGPLSLIFIDLDHFKSINDRFGHQAGDEILRVAAEHLVQNCRPYDNLARWGGEEFIILLPDTDEEMALNFAERIRNSFLQGLPTSIPIQVTTSIGVAQYQSGDSVEELVEKADKALYHAKAVGRNSSIAWSSLAKSKTIDEIEVTVA